jgi:hypothetical protein
MYEGNSTHVVYKISSNIYNRYMKDKAQGTAWKKAEEEEEEGSHVVQKVRHARPTGRYHVG